MLDDEPPTNHLLLKTLVRCGVSHSNKMRSELLLAVCILGCVGADNRFANKTKQSYALSNTQARTLFYDDHQLFFTIMIYFPFVVNSWSYGIPFDTISHSFSKPAIMGPGSNVENNHSVKGASVQERDEEPKLDASASEESDNNVLDFDRRSISLKTFPSFMPNAQNSGDTEGPKSRSKRTLYMDDQEINIFLCLSTPFSVPLLKYDQDLLDAYKDKKARKEHEKRLPLVPVHENTFESQYNDHDTYSDDEYGEENDQNDYYSARAFGSHRSTFGSGKKTHVADTHRRKRQYLETIFEPISSFYSNHTSRLPFQLWSLTDSSKNEFIARSARDTATALVSDTLVGVDSRVIDFIESFPDSCTQLVLCRLGRSLINASPLQALLLYTYKGNVFGYGDSDSEKAFDAALDGDFCEAMFPSCPLKL